ncbi:uncharacterized protein LOC125025224 [Penaeus chinensis]|uniref:uncharacterized protein LOC125025224 n=1 Tax=Penaeus chinensis TaxID=139456 RepID=UPI001FB7758D|nr:uncharacterized protein LOC125025224 [Penaeus chinensis]
MEGAIGHQISNRHKIILKCGIIRKVNVGSDHKMVRGQIRLHPRRKMNKLVRKPQPNLANLTLDLKTKVTKFNLITKNRYSLLSDEDLKIDQINKQVNDIIEEVALELGDKKVKLSSNKLSVCNKETRRRSDI